ncbi:excalibur calcium-binding domain-containing protein [Mycobacterium sp. MYCO198283]|nr:excalibur calcium-binding domain-containing protein [Mycobacterium sp. MYCO198283]
MRCADQSSEDPETVTGTTTVSTTTKAPYFLSVPPSAVLPPSLPPPPPAPAPIPAASTPVLPLNPPAIPDTSTSPPPYIPAPAAPSVAEPAPESAYYSSCADARAAGAAPLHRGDPGYRSGLDRDNDGIACDIE